MSDIRNFSKEGQKLPAVGVGLMALAAFYGEAKPQETVNELLDLALEQGCTFWDTADIYSKPGTLGDNERQIGSWIRSRGGKPDNVFIATKFVNRPMPDGTRVRDGSREWCHEACQGSLERLGVDQIDLYYAHRPGQSVEVEETISALKELKDAGKIKYIGVSEFTIEQLDRMNKIAHIDAYQVEISPWTPEVLTNGLLEWCEKNGTTVVAYSPLGRGMLTGKFKTPEDLEDGDFRKHNPRFIGDNFYKNLELVKEIEKLASKKGVTSSQICLAWVLAKSPSIFVIPGTTSPTRLKENIAARDVVLSKDEIAEIDAVINSFEVQGTRYAQGWVSAF